MNMESKRDREVYRCGLCGHVDIGRDKSLEHFMKFHLKEIKQMLEKLSDKEKGLYAGMLTVACIWALIEFLRWIINQEINKSKPKGGIK